MSEEVPTFGYPPQDLYEDTDHSSRISLDADSATSTSTDLSADAYNTGFTETSLESVRGGKSSRSNSVFSATGDVSHFTWKQHLQGVLLVLFLVLNAIGQGEYAQYAYTSLNFHSYYFLSWFTFTMLLFSLPLFIVVDLLRICCCGSPVRHVSEYGGYLRQRLLWHRKLTWKRYVVVSTVLMVISFGSTFMWYISLDLIPVSINSTLGKSTAIFVFILSVIFLREKGSVLKIAALIVCIAGVIVVGLGNTERSNHQAHTNTGSLSSTILGFILCVAQAFLYAVFEVVFRKCIGRANGHSILFVQTLIGVTSMVISAIPLPFVEIYHLEQPISFNDPHAVVAFLFINAAFAVTYYIAYAFGLTVTSPLYISLTSLVSIPISGVADILIHDQGFTAASVVGMCVVFVGVLLINMDNFKHKFCCQLLRMECACPCHKQPREQEALLQESLLVNQPTVTTSIQVEDKQAGDHGSFFRKFKSVDKDSVSSNSYPDDF